MSGDEQKHLCETTRGLMNHQMSIMSSDSHGNNSAIEQEHHLMDMQDYETDNYQSLSPDTESTLTLPFIGTIHFVKDKPGYAQVSFIVSYWLFGVFTTLFVIMLPRHELGDLSSFIIIVYCCIAVLCLTALWRASTLSPGRLKNANYSAAEAVKLMNENWTYCHYCQRLRGPRTSHCRRCNHCVRRRDHHCPWINNCVGEDNHFAFMQLVVYAFLLCSLSLLMITLHYYYWPNHQELDLSKHIWKIRILFVSSLILSWSQLGLVVFHHLSFIMDMTTIDWMNLKKTLQYTNNNMAAIEKKPKQRKSTRKAYADLCGAGSLWLYWLPCRRRLASPMLYRDEIV